MNTTELIINIIKLKYEVINDHEDYLVIKFPDSNPMMLIVNDNMIKFGNPCSLKIQLCDPKSIEKLFMALEKCQQYRVCVHCDLWGKSEI